MAAIAERDTLGDFAKIFPIFFGTGTQKSSTTSADPAAIQQLLSQITSGQFSKDSAVDDSQGAVAQTLKTLMEQYMPTISAQERGSGAYNDTTTRLLSNDLAARAAGQAALVQQQTVKDYAGIQQGALAASAKANTTTTTRNGPAIDPVSILAGLAGATVAKKAASMTGLDKWWDGLGKIPGTDTTVSQDPIGALDWTPQVAADSGIPVTTDVASSVTANGVGSSAAQFGTDMAAGEAIDAGSTSVAVDAATGAEAGAGAAIADTAGADWLSGLMAAGSEEEFMAFFL